MLDIWNPKTVQQPIGSRDDGFSPISSCDIITSVKHQGCAETGLASSGEDGSLIHVKNLIRQVAGAGFAIFTVKTMFLTLKIIFSKIIKTTLLKKVTVLLYFVLLSLVASYLFCFAYFQPYILIMAWQNKLLLAKVKLIWFAQHDYVSANFASFWWFWL